MTALTAVPLLATAGAVRLNITAAPGKPASAYASNFAATTDGWTATSGTLTRATTRTPVSLDLAGISGLAKRTITGLTVGATYRLRVFYATYRSQTRIGVSGIGTTSYVQGGTYYAFGSGSSKYVSVDYSFTATASSHDITVEVQAAMGVSGSVNVAFNTVTVEPTSSWAGTSITRTDANGTAVPVRMGVGQDVPSGGTTLTVYDYEAALTGTVQYQATDGLGGTSSVVSVNMASQTPAPGVWLTTPATADPTGTAPSSAAVSLVVDYGESSDSNGSLHQIIGRADPIANPGPLALRSGSMDVWCADYATAKAVRTLLSTGEVGLWRQPTYPGMDMYFSTRSVSIRPQDSTTTQRWLVQVSYDEVLAP